MSDNGWQFTLQSIHSTIKMVLKRLGEIYLLERQGWKIRLIVVSTGRALMAAHSSYSEGDRCPLSLSGLPAAHTFF